MMGARTYEIPVRTASAVKPTFTLCDGSCPEQHVIRVIDRFTEALVVSRHHGTGTMTAFNNLRRMKNV